MSVKGQLPSQFANYRVPFGPIGEQVYKRSYSQKKEDGTKENWQETVVRAVDGNLSLVPEDRIEADERDKLIGLLLDFSVLPAGRHLNASGMKGRQFLFNCHAAGIDPEDPAAHFTFTFDELMMGGGVGSNYSNRYWDTMPAVKNSIDLHVVCDENHPNHHEFAHLLSKHVGDRPTNKLIVADSREGWVDALDTVMRAAFETRTLDQDVIWTIDVSGVRERGAPLKTGGGTAGGPGDLVCMLTDFVKHLNGCVGRQLTSMDAMLMDHAIASCVVAGGKRRSSRIAVKNWMDSDIFEFINCKREDGAHWTANISVEVDSMFFEAYENDEHQFHDWARDVTRAVVLGTRANGEPGFWNRSLAQQGEKDPELMFCPNPCGEIGLQMWEACNLGHVNLEAFARKPKREMMEAFRLMTRWLIRATFGDIPQPRQRKVVDANRRIGVGFFGFHAYVALRGGQYSSCWKDKDLRATLSEMFRAVDKEAESYSALNNIPCPVKNTALAPTGTTTMLPGTTSSGQSMTAPWYKRLVRYASDDHELAVKKEEGYETFPDEDAKNTEIVVYWCEDPLVAKVRAAGWDVEKLEGQADISVQDSLNVQRMLQECYADNAVSYTINLPAEMTITEEQMEEMLMEAMPFLKGTTMFPTKSRKNAPIQPLTQKQFEAYQGRKEVTMVEVICTTGCPT